ncbi:MAG: type III-A CRISPR-associated RAMP protein Csm3 [Leptospiraceae bacterium]|nr:type III-A CRISPR-associated RAMP protein Csm3 [Leptospiraceae bacterium]
MSKIRLIKIKTISGRIETLSGLHIGQGNDSIEIGGVDMLVIKDKKTEQPFIPGSSLKGKMRSLLEWMSGELDNGNVKFEPSDDDLIARVFGNTNKKLTNGPTRLIVRDSKINEQFIKNIQEGNSLTEVKTENNINRITSVAMPRSLERVVSGTTFDFEMIYRVFSVNNDHGNKDEDCFFLIKEGLKLLELDSLGGGGSRGNGKIKFLDLQVSSLTINSNEQQLEELDLSKINFSGYKRV